MDIIHIENLSFFGKHGVYENERNVEQEFLISVRIGFDTKVAGKSDTLTDTLDYQKAKDDIQKTIEGASRYLIETLAEDIASLLLSDARVQGVEITIRKVAVWKNGIPGVTIRRGNAGAFDQ